MDIITKREKDSFQNDITREMDKHLILGYSFYTYIYDELIKGKVIIRYPGATRGCISIDQDSIITDIAIYDPPEVSCYLPSVNEAVKQFIGCKLVFTEEIK